MTAFNSILRATILLSLAVTAFIALFSVPTDNSSHFILDFIFTKGVFALSAFALYRLYPLFCEEDKWIGRFDKWLESK